MAHSPFSVFKRTSVDKRTGKKSAKYYARFFDDDGSIVRSRVLKATTATKAALEAKGYADAGAGASGDPLVCELVMAAWLEGSAFLRRRKCSPVYVRTNATVFARHYAAGLESVRISRLTPARVEKVMNKLLEAGIGTRTVNYGRQALTVVVADYARANRIPNPLQYLWKPVDEPRERGVLSPEEIGRIIVLEPAQESPRVRLAVLLGALCGLRLGEVRGLQFDDIDAGDKLVRIRHNYIDEEGLKSPKCGSARTVPAPDAILEAVALARAVAPDGSAFVVAGDVPGQPMTKRTIELGFRRVLKAIGISDAERKTRNLVFHGLRHSFVSLSRMAGVSDFLVQKLAGHKSSAMMDRYSHATENIIDFADARTRMAGAIDAARVKAGA